VNQAAAFRQAVTWLNRECPDLRTRLSIPEDPSGWPDAWDLAELTAPGEPEPEPEPESVDADSGPSQPGRATGTGGYDRLTMIGMAGIVFFLSLMMSAVIYPEYGPEIREWRCTWVQTSSCDAVND